MKISKTISEGTKRGKLKILPVSDCFECHHRFEGSFASFCSRVVEEDEEEQMEGWNNKALENSEGNGIPKWCPLKDMKIPKKRKK